MQEHWQPKQINTYMYIYICMYVHVYTRTCSVQMYCTFPAYHVHMKFQHDFLNPMLFMFSAFLSLGFHLSIPLFVALLLQLILPLISQEEATT